MRGMTFQVYTQTKPAHPRRTTACALFLFLGTALLAAQMSQVRSGDPLGKRVRLDAVGCSVRPPRGFTLGETNLAPEWQIQSLHSRVSRWAPSDFSVWSTQAEEPEGEQRIAIQVLGQMLPETAVGPVKKAIFRSRDVVIGRHPAIELWDAEVGIIVRVCLHPIKGYLAVAMASRVPIQEWHDVFDLSCRTVEIDADEPKTQ